MFDQSDVGALKLYVDTDNLVWYSDGMGPTTCSGLPPVAFMLHDTLRVPRHCRLLGTPANAGLILGLYLQGIQRSKGKVEVCSPLVCATKRVRRYPEFAIAAMRTCNLPSTLGGWHEFTRADYPFYAIASHVRKWNSVDDSCVRLLKNSALWHALSFIPHLDLHSCAKLVSQLLDPRWFIDTLHPQRVSKLNQHLGLTVQNFAYMLERAENAVAPYGLRSAELVLTSWHTLGVGGDITIKELASPAYFLYRAWYYRKGSWKGLLRASQMFTAYLRHVWLASLGLDLKISEPLFVPEQFFKTVHESLAFREHMAKSLQD